MFGIDRKILDEKFLRKLSMEGCLPAFFVLKNRIGRSNPKKIEHLLKRLPKHSYDRISKSDSLQELELRKKLLPISKRLLEMPMQALINPMNGLKTNERLKNCRQDTIKDYEMAIRRKILVYKDLKIVPKDINKIRKAIIWLNWFVQNGPTKKSDMCFSKDNLDIIAVSKDKEVALKKLFEKVKRDKRKLKKIFNLIPDDFDKKDLLSYFSSLSIKLSDHWSFIRAQKKNDLFQAYAMFLEDKPNANKFQFPIFYLFNTDYLNNLDHLEELSNLGYKRISDLGFLNLKIESNTKDREKSIFNETAILEEKFSDR